MSTFLVLLTAALAIAWVNWYFIFSQRPAAEAAPTGAAGVQEVVIRVAGGYEPSRVRLRRGVPARLVFDRQETSGCSEEVVVPAFSIRRFLPANERTPVEFTPEEAGEYEFTCGMGMLRGRLIVEEGEAV